MVVKQPSGPAAFRIRVKRVLAVALAALLTAMAVPADAYAAAAGGGDATQEDRFRIGVRAEGLQGLVQAEQDFSYETDEAVVNLKIKGTALPEGCGADAVPEAPDDGFWIMAGPADGGVELRVTRLGEDSEGYGAVLDAAGESYSEIGSVAGFRYDFYYGGDKLDMSGCLMSVEASYKSGEAGQALAARDMPGDEALPAGLSVYAVTEGPGQEAVLADSLEISPDGEEPPADGISARNAAAGGSDNNWIVVNELGTWLVIGFGENPEYRVEYYAWLPEVVKSGSTLSVLDTPGGHLPGNGIQYKADTYVDPVTGEISTSGGGGNALMGLSLDADGNVAMEAKFRKIYADETWSYQKAPRAVYIDKVSSDLEHVSNYELSEIWILKTDGNGDPPDPSAGIRDDGSFDAEVLKATWDIYAKDGLDHYGEHPELDAKLVKDLSQVSFTSDPDDDRLEGGNDPEGDPLAYRYCALISEHITIRLVYEPLFKDDGGGTAQADGGDGSRLRKFAATMYDYDITDDGKTTGDGSYWADGKLAEGGVRSGYGINDAARNLGGAADGKTVFAFGNGNTGTGLWNETVGGMYLNKYNGVSYQGCTFGIPDRLSGEGTIIYSDGIAVPRLFNEPEPEDGPGTGGKTAYPGSTLTFKQVGSTYTLSGVSVNAFDGDGQPVAAEVGGLEKFGHPGVYDGVQNKTVIWTNHFWPMDGIYNADPHTGGTGAVGSFTGYKGSIPINGYGSGNYPANDDGEEHNCLFGMHYTIDFEVSGDYVGPLEYLFFGDDDMWVFLSRTEQRVGEDGKPVYDKETGRPVMDLVQGEDGRLVCDIGGLHRAVGEYVDLWDWVDRDEDGDPLPQTYRLSFFYTERGLSGSTCYMQFTLPSVSQSYDPKEYNNKITSLSISKQVGSIEETDGGYVFEPADGDAGTFDFTVVFRNPDVDLKGYAYEKHGADGNVISDDDGDGEDDPRLIQDMYLQDGSGGPGEHYMGFAATLRHGEKLIVKGLPAGTEYLIAEEESPGYFAGILAGGRLEPDADTGTSGAAGGATFEDGRVASGTIGGHQYVTYVNTPVRFELPRTGGEGTGRFTAAGAVLAAAALVLPYVGKRRRDMASGRPS